MAGNTALLVLDVINEIVHPDGKYAQDGYSTQVAKRNVLANISDAINRARILNIPIIFVVIGYSENYVECPGNSALLTVAKDEKRLLLGTWATQIHASLQPAVNDAILVKHRISPFYQTHLQLLLQQLGVDTILLTGVSTEYVILSTARDAHDRGYNVVVLEEGTAAASEERHKNAISFLAKTAKISSIGETLTM